MAIKIDSSWQDKLSSEFKKEYFKTLIDFVKNEYQKHQVFPPGKLIFNAFNTTPFEDVKVVVIGQDPYHGEGQANGLSFSVNEGVDVPPSLRNIYKEIESDLGKEPPEHGDLSYWAKQGVLLLNATLTVKSGDPGSHQGKGWERFTDQVIKTISNKKDNVVFLLWGNFAKSKSELIDEEKHFVLKSTHPSPFSAHKGFLGSKHFSQANKYLILNNKIPIDWAMQTKDVLSESEEQEESTTKTPDEDKS